MRCNAKSCAEFLPVCLLAGSLKVKKLTNFDEFFWRGAVHNLQELVRFWQCSRSCLLGLGLGLQLPWKTFVLSTWVHLISIVVQLSIIKVHQFCYIALIEWIDGCWIFLHLISHHFPTVQEQIEKENSGGNRLTQVHLEKWSFKTEFVCVRFPTLYKNVTLIWNLDVNKTVSDWKT